MMTSESNELRNPLKMKILCLVFMVLFIPSFAGKSKVHLGNSPTLLPGSKEKTVVFKRVNEPNENAFSLLIPQGWKTQGGIFRIDPNTGGGSGNAIEAKFDFAVMSNESGEAMLRWLPEMNYFDMRNSPAGQMGLFPTGSNYNGMRVIPLLNAAAFIQQVVIPYAHPQISELKFISSNPSQMIVQQVMKEDQFIGIPFQYDAAVVEINYLENGIKFREILLAVTQDFGQLGAGLWKNRHTFLVRAPEDSFEQYEPLFQVIIGSFEINMNWLIGEIQGQVYRNTVSAEVLRSLQQMDREITDNRMKTNAQINHDMFLTLNRQEEYINPFTNKVEVGSNEWNHRWVNPANEVIYTDDINYNPNKDQLINRSDFKLTPVKK